MTPWVTRLIIANVIMFLFSIGSPDVTRLFMLVPAHIILQPWTLITYMFLHGGFWHVAFNMLGLYFFGPRLEITLGSKKFVLLYFVSGICGGLLSFVFAPDTPIIGASAAVFGVFYAFAHYWPRERLYIWGVFPVQARWMVIGMTVLSLFGGFGGFEQGIAHFAHLGGFIGGFFVIKWVENRSRAAQYEKKISTPVPRESDIQRWMNIPRDGMHPLNLEELDRILAKIKSSSAESLMPNDIAFLNRFSDRQVK